MTDDPSDGTKIGYKNPPRATRWQKGQSGNPNNKRPHRSETEAEMIERHLMSRVTYTCNDGTTRSITKIAAIVQRLIADSHKGNASAFKVLQKYKIFARQHADSILEIEFEDDEQVSALTATDNVGEGHD
jgi:hypothetical protein